MAKFTANHDKLYFDTLCRTKKAESVLSLIQATYQVKGKSTESAKEEIAKKLVYAYELFKGDSGSYSGDQKQFESQYTIGHELCIWKNGNLDLTDLAVEVAENRITIRDYFDIIFLNYIQPVNNQIVHVLYHLLIYMKEKGLQTVTKSQMIEAYQRICHIPDDSPINGTFNMLLATNYFKSDLSGRQLIYCGPCSMDELISRCDITYVEKGYDTAKTELGQEEDYIKYLQHDYRFKTDGNDESLDDHCVEGGENILFYGVPGVGKSYEIDSRVNLGRTERVVFYPDYTYSDFVGQILPRLVKDNQNPGQKRLSYIFEPGPFTRMLKKAESDKSHMYYLVIEEINRGNAPAVFGDLFQLLDRTETGRSKYGISNFDISEEVYQDTEHKVYIPSNLTIYATMNTSDQNVFTLDTAFQRRWQMHLIKNDIYSAEHAYHFIEGSKVTWGRFAEVINSEIISFGENMGTSEDKRIGAYFASSDDLAKDRFAEKVLKYLWDDAFKMDHSVVFDTEMLTLDMVIETIKKEDGDEDILKRVLNSKVYGEMVRELDSTDTEIE